MIKQISKAYSKTRSKQEQEQVALKNKIHKAKILAHIDLKDSKANLEKQCSIGKMLLDIFKDNFLYLATLYSISLRSSIEHYQKRHIQTTARDPAPLEF